MEPEEIARLLDEEGEKPVSGKIVILMKRGTAIEADVVKRSKVNNTIYAAIGQQSDLVELDGTHTAKGYKEKNPFTTFVRMTAPGEKLSRMIIKYKNTRRFEHEAQRLKEHGDWHRTQYVYRRPYKILLTMRPDNIVSINGKPADQWEG
jgi:hypothetical protein